ncbi:MAG: MoxR family ATPase [Candidatus Yanofskybacteria bacterium]|nr:MoxR family ATPase [Candidatus Yanofskybacteria bacterium]
MALTNPDEGRMLLGEVERQPNEFVFGVKKAIFNTVLALATPVARDGDFGKEYAQAHVYLLDLPGRGKTAILRYLSVAIRAKLGRVDGRADTLPSDLTGYEHVDRVTGVRTLLKGPLHSNIFFNDEINRTPPKGQSPMLGGMEGGYVIMNVSNTKTGELEAKRFSLYPISDDPNEKRMFFICLATANPIEFEGTYPLSEAQKERFTYGIRMGLPDRESEMMIRPWNVAGKKVKVVMDLATLLDIQDMVKQIRLSMAADEYVMRLIENSRPYSQDLEEWGKIRPRKATPGLVDFVNRYVVSGCSPRRNFHMVGAAQAFAFMRGEDEIATVDDVRAIASITMEHVILLQPRAEGDGVTARNVVQKIIDETFLP